MTATDGCKTCRQPRLGDLRVCYDCARLCGECKEEPSEWGICPKCMIRLWDDMRRLDSARETVSGQIPLEMAVRSALREYIQRYE